MPNQRDKLFKDQWASVILLSTANIDASQNTVPQTDINHKGAFLTEI